MFSGINRTLPPFHPSTLTHHSFARQLPIQHRNHHITALWGNAAIHHRPREYPRHEFLHPSSSGRTPSERRMPPCWACSIRSGRVPCPHGHRGRGCMDIGPHHGQPHLGEFLDDCYVQCRNSPCRISAYPAYQPHLFYQNMLAW